MAMKMQSAPMTSGPCKTACTISDTDVAIEIIGMNKWYGDFHVLKDINLKVMRGERIVIAGPPARANRP